MQGVPLNLVKNVSLTGALKRSLLACSYLFRKIFVVQEKSAPLTGKSLLFRKRSLLACSEHFVTDVDVATKRGLGQLALNENRE